jgi:flagellar basal body-associated protein FliL
VTSPPEAQKEGKSPVILLMVVAIACVLTVFGIAVWDMTHEPPNVVGGSQSVQPAP